MQVHCDEGLANRIGTEPCAGNREVAGEASVGEHAGQPLSRESYSVLGADAVLKGKATRRGAPSRAPQSTRRGRRPWHVWTLLAREPGDLLSILWASLPQDRFGKARNELAALLDRAGEPFDGASIDQSGTRIA